MYESPVSIKKSPSPIKHKKTTEVQEFKLHTAQRAVVKAEASPSPEVKRMLTLDTAERMRKQLSYSPTRSPTRVDSFRGETTTGGQGMRRLSPAKQLQQNDSPGKANKVNFEMKMMKMEQKPFSPAEHPAIEEEETPTLRVKKC